MRPMRGLFATSLLATTLTLASSSPAAASEGQMTWGLHFSPTPTWFDAAEITRATASYSTLYALHDAVTRPSPGPPMAAGLAAAESASPEEHVYECVVR